MVNGDDDSNHGINPPILALRRRWNNTRCLPLRRYHNRRRVITASAHSLGYAALGHRRGAILRRRVAAYDGRDGVGGKVMGEPSLAGCPCRLSAGLGCAVQVKRKTWGSVFVDRCWAVEPKSLWV